MDRRNDTKRNVLTLWMGSELQWTDRHIADANVCGAVDLQYTQNINTIINMVELQRHKEKNKGTLNSESTTPPLSRGSMEAVEDVSVRVNL